MANRKDFGAKTEATTVAEAFSSRIANKIILITGVNAGGIGGSTTEALAAHSPKLLILSGRTHNKVEEVIEKVNAAHPHVKCRYLHLDLSSQRSVRAAAKEVMSYTDVPQIDILINNAGIMNIPERTFTEDGIELTLATNHIGHFLFTNLILSKLIASASGSPKGATRIVNLSSRGLRFSPIRFSDLNFSKTIDELPVSERPDLEVLKAYFGSENFGFYHGLVAYGQSKSANVLLLARSDQWYSDPAALKVLLDRHRSSGLSFKTLGEGAATTLVAALDPELGPANKDGTGIYMEDCQLAETAKWATDPLAAEKLWSVSEDLVGEKFPV